ncbi:hypothetical protein MMC11_008945 [Xylographa trunciseda]|nr:hypothetical protein [Xylographa trunciseda]
MSKTTSDVLDPYFIVRSEHSHEADSSMVAIFHGVYPSSADAWLKVSEIVDDLNTQSHQQGIGKGKSIRDVWLGNKWHNADGYTAIFTITPIEAR